MYDNTHILTVAKDFSRIREREHSISGTFVRLNVFDYKKAEQSDQEKKSNIVSIELRQVACSNVVRI